MTSLTKRYLRIERRGRPRVAGERWANDRLKPACQAPDMGTPELQLKRGMMIYQEGLQP